MKNQIIMKINKIFLGCLGVVAMLFAACSENKDDDYQWASVSGDQVFFSNELPSTVELSRTSSTFSIPVQRLNGDAATTVSVTKTDESGLFNVPTSLSFGAGQKEANLVVGYDDCRIVVGLEMRDPLGDNPKGVDVEA